MIALALSLARKPPTLLALHRQAEQTTQITEAQANFREAANKKLFVIWYLYGNNRFSIYNNLQNANTED